MAAREKSESTSNMSDSDVAGSIENPLDTYWLEPQFYPDPALFRANLETLTKDDIELKKNLTSNKATLRVLAPYLRTIYTDQKRILDSAKSQRARKTKCVKTIYDEKSEDLLRAIPDIEEKFETIIAIHETADVLQSLLRVNSVVSYMVNSAKGQLYQNPRHIVSSPSKLASKIEKGSTIAAYSAYTKDHVVSESVYADERFPLGLGYPSTISKYAMCVPVKTPDDRLVAVYELTRDAYDVAFSNKDLQVVLAVTGWMGVAVAQNDLYNSLAREKDVTDHLLQLSDRYHCNLVDVDKTLTDIVHFAREIVGAEHCSLYVVEKENKGALILEEYDLEPENKLFKRRTKRMVELDGSVLSGVLFSKQTVNNCYQNFEVSTEGELVVRSILCMPIFSDNNVIGAIQLTNKRTKIEFDQKDEEILESFATFCAININHFRAQKNVNKTEWLTNVNKEMVFYHMKPNLHEHEVADWSKTVPDQFFTFGWSPAPDDLPRLAELSVHLFQEALGDTFMLSCDVPKFILTVQKCYRPNHYHNFVHAFYVTHAMANIIIRYHGFFSGAEKRGLMVAALCHAVDHRGQSNIFIDMTKHYLSDLYSASPLENHHFAVSRMIIQQCKLFKGLAPDVYDKILQEIHDNILATDTALYFQFRNELRQTTERKNLTFEDPTNRRLVKNFIMLACYLSDQTHPFPLGQRIAEGINEEMYSLGDIMYSLGFQPLPFMDRGEKDMIGEERIQYLSVIVLPCVKVVSKIFNAFSAIEENAKVVLGQWKELILSKNEDVWNSEESIPNESNLFENL